jgi:hypothetical protein
MEAGRQNPGLRELTEIAQALDSSIGVLVGETDDDRLTKAAAVAEEAAREVARINAELADLKAQRAELAAKRSAALARLPKRPRAMS